MTSEPVGWPALIALGVGYAVFLAMLLAARSRREPEAGASRARKSWLGIAVQGVGIAVGSFGIIDLTLPSTSAAAIGQAVLVAVLMAATIALFTWASRTMGRNWSLVARTREDHALVTAGPFAYVRHPIYVALFLMMLALSIALGHTRQLVVGIPLYALGTWLRIREEERLLRTMFGADYDAYAARVARFVPGLF